MAFLVGTCLAGNAAAQSYILSKTRSDELRALADNLRQRDQLERSEIRDYARNLGIPLKQELPSGRVLELQRIAPGIGPVFYITNNVDAADTISTDEVWTGGSAGLNLDGAGMTVAEWDGGAVYSDHPDFAGRLTQVDGATEVSGHSTHVAGTLAGEGGWLLPEARGMAYAANLDAYDWNSDTAEMAAAAASGQLVSNHSYGIAAGWLFIGDLPPDQWWWIGGSDPTDLEDPNFGYYDIESQLWDQIAFDAPYYLPVKAAGNDRSDFGAAPGEEYTVIDQDGNFLFTSTVSRPADCAPAGYDCLPTHSVAKNILTVGAVDDVPGGYSDLSGPGPVNMADFSSWGPTDDGRIKPDVVGNGVLLYSTWHVYPYFALGIGTSMAAPNVTGSLLLLQQHYENLNGVGNYMRAATLKVLAIHTADETGDAPGPDYEYGWGLMNTRKAAGVITQNGNDHEIIEGSLANGGVDNHVFSVADSDSVLTATLVWTDPPGTPPAPSLDPPDLMLVNDLDLRIVNGPTTHFPWVLNPANPAAAATTGDNFRDNVEQVEVLNPGPGSFTIEVSHKGALLNGFNQDYSLIISETSAPPMGSGYLIDEDFSGGMPAGWSVETASGIPWSIRTPVPGGSKYDNITGGSGNFAMVDNNWTNSTLTSLRTPVLDLSTNDAAVLSFRSHFYFDLLETIDVDVSTNGGLNWTNVWEWIGFNNAPTNIVLDLTSSIAGFSNVMIRFRYDSHGDTQGNFWQVDDVRLEVFGGELPVDEPPGVPFGPVPLELAVDVDIDSDLSWAPGPGATSHDVWFGTSSPLGGSDFEGNHTAVSFDPGTLSYDTTYYWQVDAVNNEGTTAGPIWSFTTQSAPPSLPDPASAPNPTQGATGVNIDADISWAPGAGATSHDVYFGTTNPPGGGELQGNQAAASYDPGTLSFETTYYWRIDEVNAAGTTAGTVWSFTTNVEAAESVHLADISGAAVPQPRGKWTAQVGFVVENQGGTPEAGVTVDGNWSNGANGTGSCVTDGGGACTISKNNLKNNVSSVDFTVTALTRAGMPYNPGDNEAGPGITISKNDVNQTPSAANDSYQTDVDVAVIGNVMTNDNQGDGPAAIDNHSLPSSGSLNLNLSDGSFTYTPNPGFEGSDSFTYSLIDQDGDVSNTATVSITIASSPPPGILTVTTFAYKVKGKQTVDVSWQNFSSGTVEITRDNVLIPNMPTNNDEFHTDDIGVKGGGVTYTYVVCETGTSNCASATAIF